MYRSCSSLSFTFFFYPLLLLSCSLNTTVLTILSSKIHSEIHKRRGVDIKYDGISLFNRGFENTLILEHTVWKKNIQHLVSIQIQVAPSRQRHPWRAARSAGFDEGAPSCQAVFIQETRCCSSLLSVLWITAKSSPVEAFYLPRSSTTKVYTIRLFFLSTKQLTANGQFDVGKVMM